jgi:hypothetical protein
MKIYLDDNVTDRGLAALLRKAGHAVVLPVEVGLSKARTRVIWLMPFSMGCVY